MTEFLIYLMWSGTKQKKAKTIINGQREQKLMEIKLIIGYEVGSSIETRNMV